MPGFIATADSPEQVVIRNSAFYPDIDATDLREAMLLDGTVTTARLYEAVLNAIASANADLCTWRIAQQAQGYNSLSAVPAELIDGESILVAHYRRAVYCLAAANLQERFRSFDTTGDGHRAADRLEIPIDGLRRDARWAIRDILGISRSTVELI